MRVLQVLSFSLSLYYSVAIKDEKTDCADRVKRGECQSNSTQMMQDCFKSCTEHIKDKQKFDIFQIDKADEEAFFDLSARTYTGELLNFDRFEGYVTMVINMAKQCKSKLEDPESYFSNLESLQKVWPYSLEMIVFPFEYPDFDYEKEDCVDFEEAAKKPGRSVHIMEMVEFNGPIDEIHPVYRYFKSKSGIEDLDTLSYDTPTSFIVNTDGRYVEVHQAASLQTLKNYLSRMFKEEL